jgi:hypothetical protein
MLCQQHQEAGGAGLLTTTAGNGQVRTYQQQDPGGRHEH